MCHILRWTTNIHHFGFHEYAVIPKIQTVFYVNLLILPCNIYFTYMKSG